MTYRGKPANYGKWWNSNGHDSAWYRRIFAIHQPAHDAFMQWASSRVVPSHVLEVGCGCTVTYPTFFSEDYYVGVDISEKEIEWSKRNDPRPHHRYVHGDIEELDLGEKFDLVFSHAVVDHVTDVDRFLLACASYVRPGGSLYVSSYRVFNNNFAEHQYAWNPDETCSYNNISHVKVRKTLEDAGLTHIEIIPVSVNNASIRTEAAIRALRGLA